MDIRKLIEEINRLTEDELVDEYDAKLDADVQDNTTETLTAKAKISRALDILKDAIEDFKNATIEEIDLVADADLTASFESLDKVTSDITNILAGKSEVEKADIDVDTIIEPEEKEESEEEVVEEEPEEEVDFDTEAGLDLFAGEE